MPPDPIDLLTRPPRLFIRALEDLHTVAETNRRLLKTLDRIDRSLRDPASEVSEQLKALERVVKQLYDSTSQLAVATEPVQAFGDQVARIVASATGRTKQGAKQKKG